MGKIKQKTNQKKKISPLLFCCGKEHPIELDFVNFYFLPSTCLCLFSYN